MSKKLRAKQTSAKKNQLPPHLIYYKSKDPHFLSQVFNPDYEGYGKKIRVSYGVWHPKEIISRFHEMVLSTDLARNLFHFVKNSNLYGYLNQKNQLLNPVLSAHLKLQAHVLANTNTMIFKFGQIRYLFNKQLHHIKEVIDAEYPFYQAVGAHFNHAKWILADSLQIQNIKIFSAQKLNDDYFKKLGLLLNFCHSRAILSALIKPQDTEFNQQNIDLIEFKTTPAQDWLNLLNKKIATGFAENLQEINLYHNTVCQYINILNDEFTSVFKKSHELTDLHKSIITLFEAVSTLKIAIPPILVSEQKLSVDSDIVALYQFWFKKINQACQDYLNIYVKLGLIVATPEASLTEVSPNLFSLWARINDSFLFRAETNDLKSHMKNPAIWLAPVENVEENIDIINYVFPEDKTLKTFENCISVQEKWIYLDKLYQYLMGQCFKVNQEINLERKKIMTAIVDHSDAFMLGVPSNNKSLIVIKNFINPHGYIRELISSIAESQRNPLWEPLLDFADRYFQLVYKTHYIQHLINKKDVNDTSDELIGELIKTPLYKNEIDLFLELVAKTEEAALNLNNNLGKPLENFKPDNIVISIRADLALFANNILTFDKEFESMCNNPTSGAMGLFSQDACLKVPYVKLYSMFNQFRKPARKHASHKDKLTEDKPMLDYKTSGFQIQFLANLNIKDSRPVLNYPLKQNNDKDKDKEAVLKSVKDSLDNYKLFVLQPEPSALENQQDEASISSSSCV